MAMKTLSLRFRSWLDHTLSNGVYSVQGTEVVCGKGRRPGHRLSISEVHAWQVCPEMGFDVIVIDLTGGRQLRWMDKYGDLISILRMVTPEKESNA